jgi:hydroxypyruvate isomerase
MKINQQCVDYFSRRQLLAGAAGLAGAAAMTATGLQAQDKPAATKGRINQSIVHWCFSEYWDVERTAGIAKQLGCKSVELIAPENWAILKKHGLTCAISPSHLFVQGMNNPKYHGPCIELMTQRIDQAAEAGVATVITFTGYAADTGDWAGGGNPDLTKIDLAKAKQISAEDGVKNCVAGFKKIVGHAEKKKVNLSLEMLNTREDTHPMKGHPGYQGDHVDYCMEIIKQVGSPRLGLLFDIYHVQIMDGDVIRRIRQCGEAINHVHTAGNPGRGELDDNQEINYPPCMKALVEIGYKGYVGQEFIPTRDPFEGLTEAVKLCDV